MVRVHQMCHDSRRGAVTYNWCAAALQNRILNQRRSASPSVNREMLSVPKEYSQSTPTLTTRIDDLEGEASFL
ncbi:hypothetical protein TKK_0005503 [Trichogramma kaykai]